MSPNGDLFHFPQAARRDPMVAAWFETGDPMRSLALTWFEEMRGAGADVRELLHDGHPIACAGDAAFGYVDAFRAHVNVGFYQGADLADPKGLLEGTGRRMRHVKLRWGERADDRALRALVSAAYRDMRARAKGR